MRSLIIFTLFFIPAIAAAQTEISLFQENIPFIKDAANLTIEQYANALYQGAISIAAILVVIKLVLAGTKYMLSEVVTNKEEAKKDIRGALIGMLLILSVVTILNTINPNLTRLDIFRNANQSTLNVPEEPVTYSQSNFYELYTYPDCEPSFDATCNYNYIETRCYVKSEETGLPLTLIQSAETGRYGCGLTETYTDE